MIDLIAAIHRKRAGGNGGLAPVPVVARSGLADKWRKGGGTVDREQEDADAQLNSRLVAANPATGGGRQQPQTKEDSANPPLPPRHDPISILDGLPLLPEDRGLIAASIIRYSYVTRFEILRHYRLVWEQAVMREPIACPKDNAGRIQANTWLQEISHQKSAATLIPTN